MLKQLEEIISKLPWDIVEGNTIFVELDLARYEEFKKEIDLVVQATAYDEQVADIGRAIRLNYMDRMFIITYNKKAKDKQEEMYVAFRTKVNG